MSLDRNLAVVIPTYKAKSTIIQAIDSVLDHQPKALILVVDDSSPDKTASLVRSAYRKKPNVVVLDRDKKDGRGSAVMRGFQEALKESQIQYFVEMDADLCHDSKYIKTMIEKCKSFDVVIASRYMEGSKIIGWKLKRRLLSKIVNMYLSFILQIPVSDYTNGYRCYRRRALETLDFESVISKGFIVLSETLYRLYKKGVRIGETPIQFQTLNQHESNLTLAEWKEALLTTIKLRLTL